MDVAESGPASAAQTPPPSPRPEPWHPILPARANPRPNIPLRSVPVSSPLLQYQVSVCILAQALTLLYHLLPWPLVPSGGSPSAPSLLWCPSSSVPGTAGLGGGVRRAVGWRMTGFFVGDAALSDREWARVRVPPAVCLHTCQSANGCAQAACGVCVNGVGDVWDGLACGLATPLEAVPLPGRLRLSSVASSSFKDPRSLTPSMGSDVGAHLLLPRIPGLGLSCIDRLLCAHPWSVS